LSHRGKGTVLSLLVYGIIPLEHLMLGLHHITSQDRRHLGKHNHGVRSALCSAENPRRGVHAPRHCCPLSGTSVRSSLPSLARQDEPN
jgi:hypothetical protein